jgi:hypothetical protein
MYSNAQLACIHSSLASLLNVLLLMLLRIYGLFSS